MYLVQNRFTDKYARSITTRNVAGKERQIAIHLFTSRKAAKEHAKLLNKFCCFTAPWKVKKVEICAA